jgi:hypothetical protein
MALRPNPDACTKRSPGTPEDDSTCSVQAVISMQEDNF